MNSGVHIRRIGTMLSRRLLLGVAGLLALDLHEITAAEMAAAPSSAATEKMPAADEVGTHTFRLAEWAAQLRYDDIPPAVLARAKLLVLDGIGGCRTVGDQHVQLLDARDERDIAARELGGIRDHHYLARDGDHLGVELGFRQVWRHDADLRIHPIRAEVQAVRLQRCQRRFSGILLQETHATRA